MRSTAVVSRLLLAAALLAAGSANADSRFLFVKAQKANIRAAATVRSEVVATADFGARLYVTDHFDDWYRIRLDDGRTGYIYDELVTDDQPGRLWVDAVAASIREASSPYAPVIATVAGGTELRGRGKRDDWYLVDTPEGKPGWIHEDLVDDDPPGALFVRVMTASVHTAPSPMSEVVAELRAGDQLVKLAKLDEYYHVKLADGTTGYVFKEAVRDDLPDMLFVDVPEAEIKSDPTIYGKARLTVKSGAELVAYDKVDDFYLVRGPDGSLGWIYDENVIKMGKQ
jgi:uncharacterized protein YgiM (DUF1202 family)